MKRKAQYFATFAGLIRTSEAGMVGTSMILFFSFVIFAFQSR
ncbi:hypothetical protein [Pontibacter beigongshangensis]|nr:hypothetical protein [Pontibacter beigongshangensis]